MTSPCPSPLALIRFEAGEVSADLAAHIEGCARCRPLVAELEGARRELLPPSWQDRDPVEQAVQRISHLAAERRASRWRRWLPMGLVPLALGALLLVPTLGGKPAPRPVADIAEGERSKGTFVLELYCKRGDKVFPVTDGGDFFPGDRIRFAYSKDQKGFLLIFGVDDAGQIFPYYPAADLAGIPVDPGAHVLLPESIELDGHHGVERLYAFWSATGFDEAAVRAAVGAALQPGAGGVGQAKTLPWAGEQHSFLLRRP